MNASGTMKPLAEKTRRSRKPRTRRPSEDALIAVLNEIEAEQTEREQRKARRRAARKATATPVDGLAVQTPAAEAPRRKKRRRTSEATEVETARTAKVKRSRRESTSTDAEARETSKTRRSRRESTSTDAEARKTSKTRRSRRESTSTDADVRKTSKTRRRARPVGELQTLDLSGGRDATRATARTAKVPGRMPYRTALAPKAARRPAPAAETSRFNARTMYGAVLAGCCALLLVLAARATFNSLTSPAQAADAAELEVVTPTAAPGQTMTAMLVGRVIAADGDQMTIDTGKGRKVAIADTAGTHRRAFEIVARRVAQGEAIHLRLHGTYSKDDQGPFVALERLERIAPQSGYLMLTPVTR